MPLNLSRKAGEAIDVDGPATIRIVRIRGHRVEVQVTAPDTTKIVRSELCDDNPHKPDIGGESGNG